MANLNSKAWNKTAAALSMALSDAGKQLTKQGATILTRACENWLEQTDAEWPRPYGDHEHPWLTGNLHDSIGTRVAIGNHTVSQRFMKQAAEEATNASAEETGTRDYNHIIGAQFGRLFIGRMGRVSQSAIVAQMGIGVPYAQYVDKGGRVATDSDGNTQGHGDHGGYIGYLQSEFEDAINLELDKVRNFVIRPKV